ncbi:MAG: lactate dehydrogenase [Bacteroidota bacterium]
MKTHSINVTMKVGIIGAGFVGAACAKAMLLRGICQEIVLIDKKRELAQGLSLDLSHGAVLCQATHIYAGDYSDLADANIVIITAGINEKAGKAIDRKDVQGRLRLLPQNYVIYQDIVPKILQKTTTAPILVVTDPPDPLADIAREIVLSSGASNQIISSGTFLDTVRFQIQIAKEFNCHPSSIDAMVIGEHGTSQVYVWSSARIGGELILDIVERNGWDKTDFKSNIEKRVKYANIEIIEGTGASQHGIGIVVSRIVEAMLRNEGLVVPIGIFQPAYGVTLSLPAIINQEGVSEVIALTLSDSERAALESSASLIRSALESLN